MWSLNGSRPSPLAHHHPKIKADLICPPYCRAQIRAQPFCRPILLEMLAHPSPAVLASYTFLSWCSIGAPTEDGSPPVLCLGFSMQASFLYIIDDFFSLVRGKHKQPPLWPYQKIYQVRNNDGAHSWLCAQLFYLKLKSVEQKKKTKLIAISILWNSIYKRSVWNLITQN